MGYNTVILRLSILFIYLSVIQSNEIVMSAYSPQIYFDHEPYSQYYFDSEDKSIILNCTVKTSLFSSAYIQWSRLNNLEETTNIITDQSYDINFKRELFSNGSLKLSLINEYSSAYNSTGQIVTTDGLVLLATFRCSASDSFGTIISKPANVFQIKNSSRILKYFRQPSNKTLISGDRLLLKCNLVLNMTRLKDKIRHKWFKNDQRVVFDSRTILYTDGTLEIHPVNETDSGMFKCIARYRGYSFSSRQAFIQVEKQLDLLVTDIKSTSHKAINQARLKFDLSPEDAEVELNDEVTFECKALNEVNRVYEYVWLKDGIILKPDRNDGVRLVNGNNLKINSVQKKDAGKYTCRICSQAPSTGPECDERGATLDLLVPPYFTIRPQDQNATLKSTVQFECIAHAHPEATIQWFKNGGPIYPSNYFKFDPTNGKLIIVSLIAQDEGYYQCLASNQLGSVQSVARLIILDDTSKPRIKEKKSSTLVFTSTDSPISSLTSPNRPTIKPVVHLSAPLLLKLDQAESRSLKISWQPPSIVKEIPQPHVNRTISYRITWKDSTITSTTSAYGIQNATTNKTELLVSDLKPDTTYTFDVCAVLADSKGPQAFLEAKTSGELKLPGPPVEFRAHFVDFGYQKSMSPTLKFRWKRPVELASSPIVKYRLFYEHLHYGPASSLNENLDSGIDGMSYFSNDQYAIDEYDVMDEAAEKFLDIDTPPVEGTTQRHESSYEFLLEDLKKYSTYRFRLVAVDAFMERENITGQENEGAELTIETPSDVPDGPPENLQAETINTTTILVQWSPPASDKCNGYITGYKLSIKENDKQVWNSDEATEPRKKLVSNLFPNRKYSIRLWANTVNGSGPASEWIVAETFAHEMDETRVPGVPLNLVTEPTDKSIVIHWLPPADSNVTLVRKYLLSYGINLPTNFVEIPGNRNSFIIKNLEPSSTYIVSIKAKNNMGSGVEVLKDVITKRKSALDENENLFPPLNVQAVAISPHSIEVRWTDWHLKQDETIPDDRFYTVQYSTSEMSSESYLYRNASERNVIVSNLKANTLYDFAVRLVIGVRKSDWSMTTSQMTMESSPAPRDIRIKSDPDEPSNVIITWEAPNYSLINDLSSVTEVTGYVISFLDVETHSRLKENPNSSIKWQNNYVTATENQKTLEAVVRKLKTDTRYYFKIQVRNNRAYGASSPTIIYQTPNNKGVGGGVIFQSEEQIATDDFKDVLATRANSVQNWFFLLIAAGGCSLILLTCICCITFCCCRRRNKSDKIVNYNEASVKRNYSLNESNNQSMLAHQQHLLLNNMANNNNNTSNYGDLMPPNLQGNPNMNHINFSINSSTTSTLLKQHLNNTNHNNMRTPSHLVGNPLHMNNSNHLMLMVNPQASHNGQNSSTNHTHLSNANTSHNDVEFYSNMTSQQASGYAVDSGVNEFQYQNNFKQSYMPNNMRTSSINDDNCSQNHDDLAKDLTSASEALAAANAAFNAPITNYNNLNDQNMNSINTNENIFMRNTTRPKPIAVPISAVPGISPSSMNPQFGMDSNNMHSNIRKSFKNLPMATATLIQSNQSMNNNINNNNNNYSGNHPLSFNFNSNQQQSQKLHYTARPYIIDNQVQSNDYSNHSPASSCHSSSQQSQVYDKLGNPVNTIGSNYNNTVSSKSLLQPLKSFAATSSHSNQIASVQPSSFSIPNTPAKYCESLNGNNLINGSKSPARKKSLMMFLGDEGQQATIVNGHVNYNRSNSEIVRTNGKSMENLHEKKLSIMNHNNNNNDVSNNEELNNEMANLEGIMKDLNAITAQQFEC